jgi:hypothetical protein
MVLWIIAGLLFLMLIGPFWRSVLIGGALRVLLALLVLLGIFLLLPYVTPQPIETTPSPATSATTDRAR